ncbi:MAG: hypothetical protein OEW87_07690, partial [Flavobacteriaceae bacterium]|nr:hypothetical protein [Flavobacteriaceae bacterium]
TFTVDSNTIVTSNRANGTTHIYLVENGISGNESTYTLNYNTLNVDFSHYFSQSYDVASTDVTFGTEAVAVSNRPRLIKD